MLYLILFFVEIIILFFLSGQISKTLSRFVSINVLSFIFLPGIIVHELSHFFMATILFVSAGEIEFVPKKNGNKVKLGSVQVAKTDPIRRSLIGFAPVFAGLAIIIGGVYLFSSNLLFFQNKNYFIFIATALVVAYLLFSVSNTMFSSEADMRGAIEILIILAIILAAAYALGLRPSLSDLNRIFTGELVGIIQTSAMFLLAPIFIDLFILGAVNFFTGKLRTRIS
jgi:hypothetical protein